MFRSLRFALMSVFLFTSVAIAQVTTTSVVGKVADPSGALIPGATVTVTDIDRNQSKTATSNQAGEYRVDFLLTGNYIITVTANGFKTYLQKGLQLNAGAPATVDVALSAGNVSEEVQVTSSAPLINTTNAEIGTTIDRTQITELPLVNRNAYQLLNLTPGVQTNNSNAVTPFLSFGAPAQITYINGGSDNGAGSVNYFLDGAPNTTGLRNTGNIIPNPDALEEFRVQTSAYGAPYGRFASGIINANVRSGTNQIHGAVFEFIRNTVLNSRAWGSSPALANPPYHQNNYGATLGGPIFKDKTFFFGSYAGLRKSTGTFTYAAVLPTALEKSGNFTQSVNKPNVSCNGVQYVICPTSQDQAALSLLAAWLPTANTTIGTVNPNTGLASPSYEYYFFAPQTSDDFLIKINQRFSDRHQLAVTYFNTSGLTETNGGGSNVPYSRQHDTYRQQNSIVNDTFAIRPNIVNNAWASYTRFLSNRINIPATSLASYGSAFVPQGALGLPNVVINGFFTLGNSAQGPGDTDNYALRDVVTWTKGKHTIQYGAESVLDKSQKIADLTNYGSFTFNGGVTKAAKTSTTPAYAGNAFADFLLGAASAAEQDAPAHVSAVTFTTSTFLQDDYRFTPKLTLNLGIRWDIQTPPVDTANREVSFVPGQQSTVRPNAPAGLVFPGDQGVSRGITATSYKHFSPRVGFAYDPFGNGTTAIRGGFGIFWGSASEEVWLASGNSVPFADRYQFSNVSSLTGVSLSNPYRNNPGGSPFPYAFGTVPAGSTVFPTGTHTRFPYTYQMNLQVQQQLTSSLALTVAYVGSLNREQFFAPDANYPTYNTNYGGIAGTTGCGISATIAPTTSNSQCRRPYQAFGQVYQLGSGQTSYYHSLQTSVSKHFSNHLSLQAFEVWSRAISSVELEGAGPAGNNANVQDSARLSEDRGRTDNDYRNVATIALVYQPDYYAGKERIVRLLLNGWEISPIAQFTDGAPFQVANGLDANLDNVGTDRAQVVGNAFTGGHTRAEWFNTAAFAQNPAAPGVVVDGNEPRNYLTGPGSKNVNLALARTFPITERVRFQFRGEATNAFNIVNASNPATTITQPSTFGVITTSGPTRVIQFGGKILF